MRFDDLHTITYLSIKKQMLWQLDNDRAANETRVHNVKASATLNVLNKGTKIMMIMGGRKISMTRIMMKMIDACRAGQARKKIITMILTISMRTTDNKVITAANTRAADNKQDAVPARDLAAWAARVQTGISKEAIADQRVPTIANVTGKAMIMAAKVVAEEVICTEDRRITAAAAVASVRKTGDLVMTKDRATLVAQGNRLVGSGIMVMNLTPSADLGDMAGEARECTAAKVDVDL